MTSELDSLPCGHLVMDERCRVLACNAALARLAGVSAEDLRGARFDSLFTPGSRLFLQTHILPTLHADGELTEIQLSLRPRAGVDVPVLMNAVRHRRGDETRIEVVIVAMTIRARFENELVLARQAAERSERDRQQAVTELVRLRKQESLSLLAAGVAHDFNNLFCVIRGNAELVALSLAASDPARPLLAEVEAATLAASGLTAKMLAYAGAATFAFQPLGLDELLDELRSERTSASAPPPRVRWDFVRGAISLTGDRAQLRLLVEALLVNAEEASAGRTPQIRVKCRVTPLGADQLTSFVSREPRPAGGYVVLEVSDQGHGMDAAVRDRLFEPFFSTKGMGRGLGLAFVLGIVEAHRGAIQVISAPGVGTTVTVALPVRAGVTP